MKHFELTLKKMGCDKSSGTMEPDDIAYVWTREKKFPGIMKAIRWLKKHYPSLKIQLNNIDKINPYEYRCYVGKEFDNKGLSSPDVGLVYVMVRQFRFTDNDEEYGDKMFYHDGEWVN